MVKVKFLGPKRANDYYFHSLKKGAILTLSPFSPSTGDILAFCDKNQSYLLEMGEYAIERVNND